MGKYLDPKNDVPFKRIFGEHPDLLKSFLNALMPFEEKQYIESLEYLSAEQVPNNPAKKNSIVDVRCKDNYDRQFIVEMQMFWNSGFSNRMVFNASKAYVSQLDIGDDYMLLQPVYGLGIINDVFDRKTPEYYHHYRTVNCKNTDEIIKGLEFVLVELPKFVPSTVMEKKMTVLWLRFLKEIKEGNSVVSDDLLENEYIRKAIKLCEEGAFSRAELDAYDRYWDIIRTENTVRKAGIMEGMEKGIKQGRAEGLVEGMEKGRAEGLVEGQTKAIEKTVVKSFTGGASIDFISSITDLSEDGVISILQKHNLV